MTEREEICRSQLNLLLFFVATLSGALFSFDRNFEKVLNFLLSELSFLAVFINVLVHVVCEHLVKADGLQEEFFERGAPRERVPVDNTFVFYVELIGGNCYKGEGVVFVLCVLEVALGLLVFTLAKLVSMATRGSSCELVDKVALENFNFSVFLGGSTLWEPLSALPASVFIIK